MSKEDAEHFAVLVGNMFEDKLKPILERLKDGDLRMDVIEKTMSHLASVTVKANHNLAKQVELEGRLIRVEALCPRCRESLSSENGAHGG
jgi:hypothetical protein